MTMQPNGKPGPTAFPGVPGGNIPILGQRPANLPRWRCAQGHEFAGDPPMMVLPLNPLAPGQPGQQQQFVQTRGVCLFCVLTALQAQFPVTLVEEKPEPEYEPED